MCAKYSPNLNEDDEVFLRSNLEKLTFSFVVFSAFSLFTPHEYPVAVGIYPFQKKVSRLTRTA